MTRSRGVSLPKTAKTTETRKEKSSRAGKWVITIGQKMVNDKRSVPSLGIHHSEFIILLLPFASHRNVIGVEHREDVEHAGRHQKGGAVIRADEEGIATGVSKEFC